VDRRARLPHSASVEKAYSTDATCSRDARAKDLELLQTSMKIVEPIMALRWPTGSSRKR